MIAIAQLRTREPLGATGNQSHRFLFHHVPLAIASAVVFVLWMTLPLFQAAHHGREGHSQAEHSPFGPGAPQAGHQGTHQASDHHGRPQSGGSQGPALGAGDPPTDGNGHHTRTGGWRQDRMFMARVTTSTGYVALGLLAFTLLVGPANLLLRRRNPVSNYLRRDAGAWTTIVSVIHFVVGLQVHGPPPPTPLSVRMLRYFFGADGRPLTNSFGLGNWTGLAATVIAVGLLAISSDFALRKLKAGPWKWLQRLNYALFALVIAHAIFYGALMRVTSPSTLLLGLSVLAAFVGQLVGVWLWRRRSSRTAPAAA